jgi:hypothetical protein
VREAVAQLSGKTSLDLHDKNYGIEEGTLLNNQVVLK